MKTKDFRSLGPEAQETLAYYRGLTALRRSEAGQAFRVRQAVGLVEVFAEVYATALGSRVVKRSLVQGKNRVTRVDDHVRFANLVLVSQQGPFAVAYPGSAHIGGSARSNGQDRGRGQHLLFHGILVSADLCV